MAVSRTDIEKALDEIVSNEEGMRFQGIAITLAKRKWPSLIACERKKDLGLDAHAPAILADDNRGIGLACSITNDLGKVSGDAETAKKNFDGLVTLIFCTPHKVTNETQGKWKEDVRKKHGLELILVTREDIITSLMQPENAAICRAQLRIPVPIDPTSQSKLTAVNEASSEVSAAWTRQSRTVSGPLIPLSAIGLNPEGSTSGETFEMMDIQQALSEGRRIILEGPAGRGKTTTLIQIARARIAEGNVALLIDLPDWVYTTTGIFDFVARSPQYSGQSITSADLTRLAQSVHLTFLLNGWNEISEDYNERAVRALADLERNFPAAGIIVATRNHVIAPPLPGARRMRLRRVTPRQRKQYLRDRLGDSSNELLARLEGNTVLNELSLTPLILSEVTTLFEHQKPVPDTKLEILDSVISTLEQTEHHRVGLASPPLSGRGREYLIDLAAEMTAKLGVRLDDTAARRCCSNTARQLSDDGQISSIPDPSAILTALCAHHALERLDYPSISYRFNHQQIQELLTSRHLSKVFADYVHAPTPEKRDAILRDIVNKPIWAEAICLFAEELRLRSENPDQELDAKQTAHVLLGMALSVDPIFASELAQICGNKIWAQTGALITECLRSWYASPSDANRQCAIEAMLATGAPDFMDMLVPLYANKDRSFGAIRDSHFHLSSFGPDWRLKIRSWPEDQRIGFLLQAIDSDEIGSEFSSIIAQEPSPRARASLVDQFAWRGSETVFEQTLEKLDDDTFGHGVLHMPPDYYPSHLKSRAIAALRKLVRNDDKPASRIHTLLLLHEFGETKIAEDLRAELENLSATSFADDYHFLKRAVDFVAATDRTWAQNWVTERLLFGSLWSDEWYEYIVPLNGEKRIDLYRRYVDNSLQHRDEAAAMAVLLKSADEQLSVSAFRELCGVRREMTDTPDPARRDQWEKYHRIEQFLLALRKDMMVKAILACASGHFDDVEYKETIRLVGRIGREPNDYPETLGTEIAGSLRTYIKAGIEYVLAQDDYHGSLKQCLSLALARVGLPEDLSIIERIIAADIIRVDKGRVALARGRNDMQGQGARSCHTSWHILAVEILSTAHTDDVLLRLLKDSYYGPDVAPALVQRALTAPSNDFRGSFKIVPREVWAARENPTPKFWEVKRQKYVSALREQIDGLEADRARSDKPENLDRPLRTFARMLALLDPGESKSIVIRVFGRASKYDSWNTFTTVKFLLEGGVALTTAELQSVLDPTIDILINDGFWNDNNASLFIDCLSAFAFASDPEAGIAHIRDVLSRVKFYDYQMRDLIDALGASRCDAAAQFLLDLEKGENGVEHVGDQWLSALCELATPTARATLLSMVDPSAPSLRIGNYAMSHRPGRISGYIARLAERDHAIKARLFSFAETDLPGDKRKLLGEVLTQMGTTDALLAGLNLISDAAVQSGVSHGLWSGIENFVVERRPLEGSQNAFSLHPRDGNAVRRRLLEMSVRDERRKKAALNILGEIELLRQRYGRPQNELRHPALDEDIPWPVKPAQATN